MKKWNVLALCLLFVLALAACSNEEKKITDKEQCAPLNPNGDSELAVLMREMAKLSEENALALKAGKELVSYDGHFSKIISAERSMNVDEQFYQGMAKVYLSKLDELYKAAPEKRIELHNNLVRSCQDCHSQTCRGPLKRIDKMLVSI
jgi:hypothetical protein